MSDTYCSPQSVVPPSQEPTQPMQTGAPRSRQTLVTSALVVAALIALGVGLSLANELGPFIGIGSAFLPLAALAALAYLGRNNAVAAVFAYIMLAIDAFGVLFYSVFYLVLGLIRDFDKFNALVQGMRGASGRDALNDVLTRYPVSEIFAPNAGQSLLWGLLLLFLGLLVSISMLFKPVRVALSRIMPIDHDNFVHKIALAFLTLLLFGCFVPLIVLGGNPPMLALVRNPSLQEQLSDIARPLDQVYQFVWLIPTAFIAAGWPFARRLRKTLVRLGFLRPTLAQVGFGLAFGVVLAVVASFGLDPAINWLWRTLGWPTTDAAAFEKLLGQFINPLGAVVIGVTAGIGEEMAVRGLLQPRIGLIASNLVFTGLHAFQYGPDALLSVFIVGLILGIVRTRTNTTTSAIVHGTYDFVLVMWSVLASG